MAGPEAAIAATAGLAGLFKSTVEWFDYVYVAKNAWASIQTELLKLDNAQLRLTRWGKGVGLAGFQVKDDETLRATGSFVLNSEQEEQAKKVFRLVGKKFEKCQKICIQYRKDHNLEEEDEVQPFGEKWNPMRRYLHDTMQELIHGRKNQVSIPRKAKFAIYDRSHLKELVKEINEQIDDLYKLYPLPVDKQESLSKEEVNKLVEVLQELNGAIKDCDPLLGSAVQTILNQKNDMKIHNEDGVIVMWQGQKSGGSDTQNVHQPSRRRDLD